MLRGDLKNQTLHKESLMMTFTFKKRMYAVLFSSIITFGFIYGITQEAREKGFIELHECDDSIETSLRYFSNENFVGKPVDGYKKSTVVLTKEAANALKKVQEELKKNGYCLVIYDAYRPQQAVNNFIQWSQDQTDQVKKDEYYPRVDKAKVFELGYVAKRSGHSRGSTIDLTIIKEGQKVHSIEKQDRTLKDGFTITFLDDGTVDMGSSFDLFDTASHTENELIDAKAKENRAYLKSVMEKHGFRNYDQEWWHFTLVNEPYPANQDSSYFDFAIE